MQFGHEVQTAHPRPVIRGNHQIQTAGYFGVLDKAQGLGRGCNATHMMKSTFQRRRVCKGLERIVVHKENRKVVPPGPAHSAPERMQKCTHRNCDGKNHCCCCLKPRFLASSKCLTRVSRHGLQEHRGNYRTVSRRGCPCEEDRSRSGAVWWSEGSLRLSIAADQRSSPRGSESITCSLPVDQALADRSSAQLATKARIVCGKTGLVRTLGR